MRASTQACACSGRSIDGNDRNTSFGASSGAVAPKPAKRKSAIPGRCSTTIRCLLASFLPPPNISRTVVTPRSANWRSASSGTAGTCTCASMRPGKSVRPCPSMASTEVVDSVASKTRAIEPFSIHTSRRSNTRSPSKTRTLRINSGAGVDCAETATKHATSDAAHAK